MSIDCAYIKLLVALGAYTVIMLHHLPLNINNQLQ